MDENQPSTPTASPPLTGARGASSALVADERALVSALVTRLRRAGTSAEVFGSPVNPSAGATLLAHAALGLLALGLGQLRPLLGLLLLGSGLWSGWREAQGFGGWVTRLVPLRAGHNVVIWGERPLGGRDRPCLVLAAPLDGGRARRGSSEGLLSAMAAPAALGLVGLALGPLIPEAGRSLSGIGAIGLGLVLLVALGSYLRQPWDLAPSPTGQLLGRVQEGLAARPLERLDLVILFGTGGARADGLTTLLLNHRQRLDPRWTRVLVLTPSAAGTASVVAEGRWRRRPSDGLIAEAAASAGLSATAEVTPASRAMAAGWRSGAIACSADASPTALLATLAALDRAAGEGRW